MPRRNAQCAHRQKVTTVCHLLLLQFRAIRRTQLGLAWEHVA